MSVVDSTDIAILLIVAAATGAFFYWRSANSSSSGSTLGSSTAANAKSPNGTAKSPAATPKKSAKKSIIETLKEVPNPNKLVLFYGSQTGTAEDLASRVAKEAATSFNIHTLVCDLEEYDMSELTRWPKPEDGKWLTGFFLATYGEGEPTDNAIEFYDWVMDGKGKGDDEDVDDESDPMVEEKPCTGLPYIIFGLGNKTYEHFNAMSRRMDRRLKALGGVRVGPNGEGDDDGSLEDDFLGWKPKIFEALAEFYGITASSGRENPHNPMYVVNFQDVADTTVFHGELSSDSKPRRWKAADESSTKFTEITTKKRQTYSVKHPFHSKVAHSRHLFKNTQDVFGVDANVQIPASKEYTVSGDRKISVERHCVHMEFDLEGSGMRYEAGDHVGILASNSSSEVERLAAVLLKATGESFSSPEKFLDSVFKLNPNKEGNPMAASAKTPFPNPCSLRTAFTNYLAITAPLKQHQLEIIAKYAQSEAEKNIIFELVDNRDHFIKNIETPQKNLREVLESFSSVKIPLSVVLGEILTHIQPRFYSISSSSKKDPTRVSVTAVVVRYVLPSPDAVDPPRAPPKVVYKEGLATSMIHRLHEFSEANPCKPLALTQDDGKGVPPPLFHVPIFIRTSSFRLPRDASLPVVMVGPGTGVAPFRGFLHERLVSAEASNAPGKKQVGPTWLFYGCRHPEQDHLYREEFLGMQKKVEAWKGEGDVRAFDLRFLNSFSRAGTAAGGKKVYVQHRLKECGEEVWEVLNKGRGYFYICGDAKNMATDVHQTLIDIAIAHGGKNDASAKAWIKNLRASGRYQEDNTRMMGSPKTLKRKRNPITGDHSDGDGEETDREEDLDEYILVGGRVPPRPYEKPSTTFWAQPRYLWEPRNKPYRISEIEPSYFNMLLDPKISHLYRCFICAGASHPFSPCRIDRSNVRAVESAKEFVAMLRMAIDEVHLARVRKEERRDHERMLRWRLRGLERMLKDAGVMVLERGVRGVGVLRDDVIVEVDWDDEEVLDEGQAREAQSDFSPIQEDECKHAGVADGPVEDDPMDLGLDEGLQGIYEQGLEAYELRKTFPELELGVDEQTTATEPPKLDEFAGQETQDLKINVESQDPREEADGGGPEASYPRTPRTGEFGKDHKGKRSPNISTGFDSADLKGNPRTSEARQNGVSPLPGSEVFYETFSQPQENASAPRRAPFEAIDFGFEQSEVPNNDDQGLGRKEGSDHPSGLGNGLLDETQALENATDDDMDTADDNETPKLANSHQKTVHSKPSRAMDPLSLLTQDPEILGLRHNSFNTRTNESTNRHRENIGEFSSPDRFRRANNKLDDIEEPVFMDDLDFNRSQGNSKFNTSTVEDCFRRSASLPNLPNPLKPPEPHSKTSMEEGKVTRPPPPLVAVTYTNEHLSKEALAYIETWRLAVSSEDAEEETQEIRESAPRMLRKEQQEEEEREY
ncbi:NADPH-cytochrome P450 reductase [Phlyctochytrium planicorne]|nr:NADPH-cytochrome P450 reductase [Phlyctochytrium planicorne]